MSYFNLFVSPLQDLLDKRKEMGQKKNLFPPLGCDNLYTKFYLRCSIY